MENDNNILLFPSPQGKAINASYDAIMEYLSCGNVSSEDRYREMVDIINSYKSTMSKPAFKKIIGFINNYLKPFINEPNKEYEISTYGVGALSLESIELSRRYVYCRKDCSKPKWSCSFTRFLVLVQFHQFWDEEIAMYALSDYMK